MPTANHPDRPIRRRRGEMVEVRSLEEILATLDAEGKLDGILFMPEMVPFCGHRFRIHRRVDKTCVEGKGLCRLPDCVLLEGLRCGGEHHDGCQRGCLFFWKTAWLKPVAPGPDGLLTKSDRPGPPPRQLSTTRNGRYYCQSTELAAATRPLSRWNVWFHLRDLFTGEASVARAAGILKRIIRNRFHRLLGWKLRGRQKQTPTAALGLQPGEWIEIRSREEIEATLDEDARNRGLSFEQEMLEYCGGRYPVAFPVRRIISEETGQMVRLQNTVVLEGVTCQGLCARNCPRGNYLYWREIWLKRVDCPGGGPS